MSDSPADVLDESVRWPTVTRNAPAADSEAIYQRAGPATPRPNPVAVGERLRFDRDGPKSASD
jgi:hypothetical protein